MASSDFVLLMRHAEHDQGRLTPGGIHGLTGVANRLAEVLALRELTVTSSFCGAGPEVVESARVLLVKTRLELLRLATLGLVPESARARVPDGHPSELAEALSLHAFTEPSQARPVLHSILSKLRVTGDDAFAKDNGVLFVGNDPLVSWIAREMLSTDVGFDKGEVACLRRQPHRQAWRLDWTITPDDRPAEAPLREKIKSKMETAKVLGGVLIALLTFLLQSFFKDGVRSQLSLLALGSFAAAAWLYLAALFFYDSLLMPSRWWGSQLSVTSWRNVLVRGRVGWVARRPPSSTARVLQQNMMRIWSRTFVPATVLVGVGVTLLFCDVAARSGNKPTEGIDLGWSPLGFGVAGALILGVWTARSRPRLGTED